MRGYLIYTPGEAEKNRQFIQMFQEEGKRWGISFSYVPLQEYRQQEPAEVVLNRTRLPEVSSWFEDRGGVVLHDSTIVENANHKWKTLLYLLEAVDRGAVAAYQEKWLPDTLYLPIEEREGNIYDDTGASCIVWKNGRESLEYDRLDDFLEKHSSCVIKAVSGHGGQQVARVGSLGEVAAFVDRFPREDVMLQEEIACASRDVRMYILGNEMYQGILRQGRGDFRSNFSLGGQVCAYEPAQEQMVQMQGILRGFRRHILGMAGIDFLLGEDGRLYFNELEEMAGCRMLYQATGKHIVGDYVEWISKLIENWK